MKSNPSAALFEPAYGHWQPGVLPGAQLARVVSVKDELNLGRVQVRLLSLDGVTDQDAKIWARVAVPFAGPDRGAFFIPDVDDEVLVTFVNGDPSYPIVVGGLWNGSQSPPESLPGDEVDRWSFTGRYGARVAIVEEKQGQSKIEISTPGEVSATLEQSGGGKITIVAAGSTITVDSSGVSIDAKSNVTVKAAKVSVTAAQVKVDTALADFSGVVKCNVLKTTTVMSDTYLPGAGNTW